MSQSMSRNRPSLPCRCGRRGIRRSGSPGFYTFDCPSCEWSAFGANRDTAFFRQFKLDLAVAMRIDPNISYALAFTERVLAFGDR